MKFTILAATLALAATSAYAEEVVTKTTVTGGDSGVARTEKSTTVESTEVAPAPATTVKKETSEHHTTVNGSGTVTKSSSSSSVTTGYTTRLESAYRAAGVADADIARLRDIDLQVVEARRANDAARIKEYYTQQTRILKPEQVTQVRTYLTEHPATVVEPAYVTTYETVPATTGVSVNTPLGSIGVGVNTGSKVVEKKTVVAPQ